MRRWLTLLIGLGLFVNVLPTSVAFAKDDISECSSACTKVNKVKKVIPGSMTDCNCIINVDDPLEIRTNEGRTEYIRKVEINNSFFIKGSKTYISGNILNIYFQYDNKSVSLKNDKVKVFPGYNEKCWKVSSSEETYIAPKQCIASQKNYMYNRKNPQSKWENADEFHVDIMCSENGALKFNIKSIDNDAANETKVSQVSQGDKKLKKGLQRCIVESNEEYTNDLSGNTDDKYKYITRVVNITYKDSDGALANVIIRANFRYNISTNEVQCLSTSYKENYGKININIRTVNETRTYGGACGEIKLRYISGCSISDYEETLIIKCDSKGNIISKFI